MKKRKVLTIMTSMAVLCSAIMPSVGTWAAEGSQRSTATTYYVSTLNGKDSNDGLSEDAAFYSLQKINDLELKPGDQILLECGSVFTNGYLHLYEQSGSQEAPIVIDHYGEGNDPVIDTNGQGVWYQNYGVALDSSSHKMNGYVSSSILLYDSEYVEINHLEIVNKAPKIETAYNALDVMNRTGVAAVAQNKGTVDHIYLNDLYVHDVIGNVYDKHMNNGGIYFTVFKPRNEAATGVSRYDGVKIENCRVERVNRWGIAVGYTAYWNRFTAAAISDAAIAQYGSGNVEIRNNYVKDAGGDAITTMYCDRPLIEYNVSDGVARQINTTDYSATGSGRVAAAIWPWKCKDAIFQYNEAFDTCLNQDGQAWDADYGDGTIYQYNYSHNNGGGCVMFCGVDAINNIFRYNISQDDLSGVMNVPSNPDAHVYNNVFYIKEGVPFIRPSMTGGAMTVENNIIYYCAEEPATENWHNGVNATYSNNLYYNYANVPKEDAYAIAAPKGTPIFENPGTAPSDTDGEANLHNDPQAGSVFDGYRLAQDSLAIHAGKIIEGNGGEDFFGNPVSQSERPDIGAHESGAVTLHPYSEIYGVDRVNQEITGVDTEVSVEEFLAGVSLDKGTDALLRDAQGREMQSSDRVTHGCLLILSDGAKSLTYTISGKAMETGDSKIHSSDFMLKDQILYVPIPQKNPPVVAELIAGIETDHRAVVTVLDGGKELGEQDEVTDGTMIRVVGEDQTTTLYTVAEKNQYHWAGDYVHEQQGNVWFAQKKDHGEYSNMTEYDSQYATWNGSSYAVVGLNGDKSATISKERMGLLCDDLMESSRKEGYSMAYRAPIAGKVMLSFQSIEGHGKAYLRMAENGGNTGGSVFLSLTKNGELLTEKIQLPNDGTGVELADMEVEVQKGDYIRVEIQNTGNPSKPSAYVTPMITYLEGKKEEPGQDPVDFSALLGQIEKAKALNSELYTPQSWNQMKIALADAEKVFANSESTQERVNEAASELEEAIRALQEKPHPPETETPGTETPGTETPKTQTPSTQAPAPQQPSLKLDKTKATIYTRKAKTVMLKAEKAGISQTITWTSSKPKVASVKNGKVTAKKPGKTVITATAGSYKASCTITVKKPSLKTAKKVTVKKGKKLKLKAIPAPKGKLKYSSSDKKIATVTKKGVVKGRAKGRCKITVTCNKVKKVIQVNVK